MKNSGQEIKYKIDTWKTHLRIDALYFHAARQSHNRALSSQKKIKKAENYWKSLEEYEEEILAKHNGDSYSAYDELEPIYIQFEGAHYQIGAAHAFLFKEVATVHILSAAALEAHMNLIAKEILKGKNLEQFEKISLEGKWLFSPKILGLTGFEPGDQPFQRFSKLLKYRNNLVHYKRLKEEWVYGAIPQFVRKLGLTLEDSKESIAAVESMIEELAKQLGLETPYWLRSDLSDMDYFEILH
jgi:hypothetical protein